MQKLEPGRFLEYHKKIYAKRKLTHTSVGIRKSVYEELKLQATKNRQTVSKYIEYLHGNIKKVYVVLRFDKTDITGIEAIFENYGDAYQFAIKQNKNYEIIEKEVSKSCSI